MTGHRGAGALELAAEQAYKAMKAHYRACALCNPQWECIQGLRLRGAWAALDEQQGIETAARQLA